MWLDVDKDVEVFSNPGKFTPPPPPQFPLGPTFVGGITAAPSEICSSTPFEINIWSIKLPKPELHEGGFLKEIFFC